MLLDPEYKGTSVKELFMRDRKIMGTYITKLIRIKVMLVHSWVSALYVKIFFLISSCVLSVYFSLMLMDVAAIRLIIPVFAIAPYHTKPATPLFSIMCILLM